MRNILILLIFIIILWLVIIYYDYDRLLRLKFSNINTLLNTYLTKPQTLKRVVLVIDCKNDEQLCLDTIKTLLDQSKRVHDIAVETPTPYVIQNELQSIVTIHKPQTTMIRETDDKTLILQIENGKIYPYGFVENYENSTERAQAS